MALLWFSQSASLLASADAGGSGDGDVQEVNIIRKAKTRHLKTLVLGIVASFFFLLLLFYPAYPAQPATWAPVLFLLVYFVYLCESLICVCQPCLKCGFGSSTFAYVSNIMSDKAAEGFVAALMAAAPVFVMTVECCTSQCLSIALHCTLLTFYWFIVIFLWLSDSWEPSLCPC